MINRSYLYNENPDETQPVNSLNEDANKEERNETSEFVSSPIAEFRQEVVADLEKPVTPIRYEDIPDKSAEIVENVETPIIVESMLSRWLQDDVIEKLKSRWNAIQIEFVNEPRESVIQADALVTETLEQIKQVFSNNRTVLDDQQANAVTISTEDLRVALQSYRSFFNRLLAL